jgi:hypothetical protein
LEGSSFYNRVVKLFVPLLAAILLFGCSKNIQTPEAVRSAVVEYLAARAPQIGLDVNSMNVEIGATTFEKDTARATVSITPKNMPGKGGMQMTYNFDRKGDKWVVRAGSSSHGTMVPPTSGDGPGGQSLPPGHPSTAGDAPAGQSLPPGHPPIGKQ